VRDPASTATTFAPRSFIRKTLRDCLLTSSAPGKSVKGTQQREREREREEEEGGGQRTELTHIYGTSHAKLGTHGGCGDAMLAMLINLRFVFNFSGTHLTGAGLCNDLGLAESSGKQDLTNSIIDLM
jgi:hypothetical protein